MAPERAIFDSAYSQARVPTVIGQPDRVAPDRARFDRAGVIARCDPEMARSSSSGIARYARVPVDRQSAARASLTIRAISYLSPSTVFTLIFCVVVAPLGAPQFSTPASVTGPPNHAACCARNESHIHA